MRVLVSAQHSRLCEEDVWSKIWGFLTFVFLLHPSAMLILILVVLKTWFWLSCHNWIGIHSTHFQTSVLLLHPVVQLVEGFKSESSKEFSRGFVLVSISVHGKGFVFTFVWKWSLYNDSVPFLAHVEALLMFYFCSINFASECSCTSS